MIKCYRIKSVNDFKELADIWKKLEAGKEMTAYQSYDWNALLVE